MTDEELAQALISLGMDEVSYRALPLLPLIQVAWADGELQEAERELILKLAAERYALSEEGQRVLRNWLHHAPTRDYVRRGQRVLMALCDRAGGRNVSRDTLADTVTFSLDVAKAAGGFFGFGAVASQEAQAIEEIAEALQIPHDRPWVTPDDTTVVPSDADQEADGPAPEVVFHAAPGLQSRASLVQYDELKGEQACTVGGDGVVIGRARECTVQINYDGQVSRRHCRVFEREGRFYVEDLESTRGTWVNGERIVERRLFGGESLLIGSESFFFQLSPT